MVTFILLAATALALAIVKYIVRPILGEVSDLNIRTSKKYRATLIHSVKQS